MAHIKTLKNNELIGSKDNSDVYPISSSQAIFRQNPDGSIPEGIQHQRLEESLQDIESDTQELHRKAEKLVVNLINGTVAVQEIKEGNSNYFNLTGNIKLETFGDESAELIPFFKLTVRKLTIRSGAAILVQENNWMGTYNYSLPAIVGTYVAKFDATYNSVSKYAEQSVALNLRKYFGFADSQPTNPETLNASDFSNSVACTITIPANGTGFKHIYFAVPNNMTITRITQPDSLNAPLAFEQIGTISRVISGTSHTYKLYQSVDTIDSSLSKRLKIE